MSKEKRPNTLLSYNFSSKKSEFDARGKKLIAIKAIIANHCQSLPINCQSKQSGQSKIQLFPLGDNVVLNKLYVHYLILMIQVEEEFYNEKINFTNKYIHYSLFDQIL